MEKNRNILAFGATDIGLKRLKNEDNFLIVNQNREYNVNTFGRLFAVADGMGGHTDGEVASKIACDGLYEYYQYTPDKNETLEMPDLMLANIGNVFININEKIKQYANEIIKDDIMGTTLSVLVLLGSKALIAHVGDSRVYRLRDNKMVQLTKDHTFVQQQVEIGNLTAEEALIHPLRNVLLQSLGSEFEKTDTRIEHLEEHDIFLLCSDGLHGFVSDNEIRIIISANQSAKDKCGLLIDAANEKGGKDNVTVIVVEV